MNIQAWRARSFWLSLVLNCTTLVFNVGIVTMDVWLRRWDAAVFQTLVVVFVGIVIYVLIQREERFTAEMDLLRKRRELAGAQAAVGQEMAKKMRDGEMVEMGFDTGVSH